MTRIRYTLVAIGATLGFTAFVVVGLAAFSGSPARDAASSHPGATAPTSVPGPPVPLGNDAGAEPHCALATNR